MSMTERESLEVAKQDFDKQLKYGLSNTQVCMVLILAEKYMDETERLQQLVNKQNKELEEAQEIIRHYGIALMSAKHLSQGIDHAGKPKDMTTFQVLAKNMKVHVSTVDWGPIDILSVGQEVGHE